MEVFVKHLLVHRLVAQQAAMKKIACVELISCLKLTQMDNIPTRYVAPYIDWSCWPFSKMPCPFCYAIDKNQKTPKKLIKLLNKIGNIGTKHKVMFSNDILKFLHRGLLKHVIYIIHAHIFRYTGTTTAINNAEDKNVWHVVLSII